MPVHRALTEPILLGGAPRAVAILNGTLAAALGPGPAALDRRPPALGRRHMPPRSGPPSAIRSSSMSCAGTCASPVISTRELKPMMNLAEYRRSTTQPCRLPALGRAGRRGRRPQQGRLVPAHGAVSRAGSRLRHAGRTCRRRRRGSTMRCAGSAPAGRSSSRRSVIRPGSYPVSDAFPMRPRRWSTPSAGPSSRRRARTSSAAIS